MKKATLIIATLLFSSASFLAQGQAGEQEHPNKEKIKSMKIAFITEKLNLTSEEAQQFWPVYNEYESKRDELRKEKKMDRKEGKTNTNPSDEEIKKQIENRFETRQKELDLDKEYDTKFQTVLPIKKVGELYSAREAFKRELLRKLKNHDGGSHQNKKGSTPPTR